jgi:hypothetical protein
MSVRYDKDSVINAEGKYLVPGFVDVAKITFIPVIESTAE